MSRLKDKTATIPAPLTGLALGLASLGAAMQSLSPVAANSLICLSGLILLTFLSKIIFSIQAFKADLNHPVFSSIIPTGTMALMIVSTFLARLNDTTGKTLWLTAILLQVILLIRFTVITIQAKNFSNIIPSYLIPPVGLVVACVTGKGFNEPALCTGIFYFGTLCCMLLLTLVFWRLSKGPLPEPKKGTLAILAAPASLCLAGYFTIQPTPPAFLLYLLVPLSLSLTLFVYILLFRYLKGSFHPGWSGFTFPLVISSSAMLKLSGFMQEHGIAGASYVQHIGRIEFYIAAAVVLYVLSGYIRFFLLPQNQPTNPTAPEASQASH